jgi:hypothetical protein
MNRPFELAKIALRDRSLSTIPGIAVKDHGARAAFRQGAADKYAQASSSA